jgi:hypothetical protein
MKKLTIFTPIFAMALFLFSTVETKAQNRKSVSAAEVTGTFRSPFTGRFKGSHNEIKILALGRGKLKVSFELIYPYISGGELAANTGTAEGEAIIVGDTAIYTTEEFGSCKITIKFVKPGTIKVTQGVSESQCGFGFNVSADGTYKKVSGAKPKF